MTVVVLMGGLRIEKLSLLTAAEVLSAAPRSWKAHFTVDGYYYRAAAKRKRYNRPSDT